MTLKKEDLPAHIERLSLARLEAWIEQKCVQPDSMDGEPTFSEADLARLRLICLLHEEFELRDEGLSVVLSLVDQLHGVRRALRELVNAVDRQPDSVRAEIAQAFRAALGAMP